MESPKEVQSRLATAVSSSLLRPGHDAGVDRSPAARPDHHLGVVGLHVVEGDAAGLPSSLHRAAAVRMPFTKRLFDIAGALLIAALFSPFILAVVVLIRLGGQPVVFRHRRIGQNGRPFDCLKFRTMVPNAEQVLRDLLREHPELRDEWTQNHKLRYDPRVTAVGRFLRRTSLDELPQLWNVIRGDMSLVGPRPIVKAELLRYGRQVSSYLAARPGLTGLWQVKGRSDTTYRRRVAMDKFYVRNRNLWMDAYIVAITAMVVLRRAGAY